MHYRHLCQATVWTYLPDHTTAIGFIAAVPGQETEFDPVFPGRNIAMLYRAQDEVTRRHTPARHPTEWIPWGRWAAYSIRSVS